MSNNRPKITDKIRFWEEQDKINNALIPRVLQIHENQKKQLTLNSSLTDDVSKAKLTIADLSEKIKSINNSINSLSESLEKQKSEVNKVSIENNDNTKLLNSTFEKLEFNYSSLQKSHDELLLLFNKKEKLIEKLTKDINGIKLNTGKVPIYISIIAILIAILSFIF